MQSKWTLILFFQVVIFFSCTKQPVLLKMEVKGVSSPEILLNGNWKFSMDLPERFWENSIDLSRWADIQVPGECQMQGFAIKHNEAYAYKHQFLIPSDFKGKRIFLNFYGVYSYARVWVNGIYVREHFGGFTKWECDITEFVVPGEETMLTVEIVDRTDDISYGSGYAKHQIGGILRDVELVAQPMQYFKQLYFDTDLDEKYENAELRINYELSQNTQAHIQVDLYASNNKLVESIRETVNSQKGQLTMPVKNPKKWEAEHPNLYTLVTTLVEDGDVILKIPHKIGFREVEVVGNNLLVNGEPVKLRGACRHDIHPLLGRVTTPEYDKMDVLLAKKANMNFIRTSHYPPSEKFLSYCDEYGIYVEDETAVCFVGSHRTAAYQESGASQNDSEFTKRYLTQLEEMVQNHRNHPSAIIWSIGNENVFGSNFIESYKWIKENDNTRPVIYSYPGHVPDSLRIFDIISMHYPSWKGELNQYGISTSDFSSKSLPMLFDEWAHVACYDNFELREDPNVRNFWGQSLDSMWTYTFEADGGLGGAIWCMIDETFMLPENLEGFNDWWGILDPNIIPATYKGPCVGYGEWGIIDTWRRKKPEFWGTKKAYSPTKIYKKHLSEFKAGEEIKIPIYNRFDHTNLSELKIMWKYESSFDELEHVDLGPHQKGHLVVPSQDWRPGSELNLRFFQYDSLLVDEYNIQIGEREYSIPQCKPGHLLVNETDDQLTLSGEKFEMDMNKKNGLFENVRVGNDVIIQSGPYLNLKLPGKRVQYSTIEMKDYAKNWECTGFNFLMNDGIAEIQSEGQYDSILVNFNIKIDEHGVFDIGYHVKNAPEGNTIQEAGLKFIVGDNFRELAWERDAYFTAYPEQHLGNQIGSIDVALRPDMNYREKPGHSWEFDTKGFYYFGLNVQLPYTNLVRSLKENIFSYSLVTGEAKIEIHSDGQQACRFDRINGKNTLIVDDQWDYNSLLWGNYMKMIPSKREFKGQVVFTVE